MRAWSRITAIVPSSSSASSSSSRVGIVLVEESNVFPALVFFGAASRKLHVSPKHPTRDSLGGAAGQDPQDPRRWKQTDSAGEAGGPPKHEQTKTTRLQAPPCDYVLRTAWHAVDVRVACHVTCLTTDCAVPVAVRMYTWEAE